MGFITRVSDWYWSKPTSDVAVRGQGSQDSYGGTSPLVGVIPPSRSDVSEVTLDTALSLPGIYRASQIITNNVMQLDLLAYKSGKVANNSLVRKPNVDQTRSKFIKRTVMCLLSTGNAYWLISRNEFDVVINLDVLNPLAVYIHYDDNGNKLYGYGNKTYRADQVKHLRLGEVPGHVLGVGPIQACSGTISGALAVASYGNNWFSAAGVPTGVLSTPDELTAEQAAQYKAQWITSQQTRSTAILGKGLSYEAIILNPAEAQWIEGQKFSLQQIALMFGIPATWLLAEIGGNSMTYSNQETEQQVFIRNTLVAYTLEIEDALTELAPNGITVKFDFNSLLRPDKKTRSEINTAYLVAGVYTVDEVRESEGLPALTAKQKRDIKAVAPAPVPTDEENTDD